MTQTWRLQKSRALFKCSSFSCPRQREGRRLWATPWDRRLHGSQPAEVSLGTEWGEAWPAYARDARSKSWLLRIGSWRRQAGAAWHKSTGSRERRVWGWECFQTLSLTGCVADLCWCLSVCNHICSSFGWKIRFLDCGSNLIPFSIHLNSVQFKRHLICI